MENITSQEHGAQSKTGSERTEKPGTWRVEQGWNTENISIRKMENRTKKNTRNKENRMNH